MYKPEIDRDEAFDHIIKNCMDEMITYVLEHHYNEVCDYVLEKESGFNRHEE